MCIRICWYTAGTHWQCHVSQSTWLAYVHCKRPFFLRLFSDEVWLCENNYWDFNAISAWITVIDCVLYECNTYRILCVACCRLFYALFACVFDFSVRSISEWTTTSIITTPIIVICSHYSDEHKNQNIFFSQLSKHFK